MPWETPLLFCWPVLGSPAHCPQWALPRAKDCLWDAGLLVQLPDPHCLSHLLLEGADSGSSLPWSKLASSPKGTSDLPLSPEWALLKSRIILVCLYDLYKDCSKNCPAFLHRKALDISRNTPLSPTLYYEIEFAVMVAQSRNLAVHSSPATHNR